MRRSVFMLLVVAMLAACVPAAPQDDELPLPSEPATPTPAAAAPTAPREPVLIRFGTQDWQKKQYETLVTRFNADNPDVRVELVVIDDLLGTYPQGASDEESRKFLDQQGLRIMQAVDTTDWFGSNERYARDLKPFIDADPAFDQADFFTGTLEMMVEYDGTIRQLPVALEVQTLSYNRDLLRERGVVEPQGSWTWPELRTAAQKIAQIGDNGVETYGLLFDGSAGYALVGELASLDPSLASVPSLPVDFSRPSFEQGLLSVADLIKTGALYVDFDGHYFINEYGEMAEAGKVGFWVTGLDEFAAQRMDVGYVALVGMPTNRIWSSASYAMSAGTRHSQEAWRWLSFLSRELQPSFESVSTGAGVPARRSVAENNPVWQRYDPALRRAVLRAMNEPNGESSALSWWPWSLAGDALEHAVKGDMPVAQAIAEAQAEAERVQTYRATYLSPPAPFVVAPPEATAAQAQTVTFGAVGLAPIQTRALARAFNRNQTDFVLEVDTNANGSIESLAQQYDCFSWWGPPSTGDSQFVLDLQPLADADATFPRDDYPARALGSFRVDGKLAGLPQRLDLPVFFFNKELFDAAGVPYPTAAWTFDDLAAAATQLTTAQGEEQQYGFAALDSGFGVRQMLPPLGVSLLRQTSSSVDFTSDKTVSALTRYLDLLRATSPNAGNDANGSQVESLITDKRVAMWLGEGSVYGSYGVGDNGSFTLGIAPLPPDENWQPWDTGLFISAQSQNTDACWTWLKALGGDVGASLGAFPARTSLATSEAFLKRAPFGAATVYQAYQALLSQPAAERGAILDTTWLDRAAERSLQGQNLQQELEDAQFLTNQYNACVDGGEQANVCRTQVDPTLSGGS